MQPEILNQTSCFSLKSATTTLMSNLIRILMYIDKKVIITMSPDWSVFPIVPQHARQLQVYVPRGICQGGADDHNYHDNRDFYFVSMGRVQKPPARKLSVEGGGGGTPLSVNFFPLGFWEPTVRGGGEGGTPPFR